MFLRQCGKGEDMLFGVPAQRLRSYNSSTCGESLTVGFADFPADKNNRAYFVLIRIGLESTSKNSKVDCVPSNPC